MPNGIIYKYTSPSGKCYIGQTINSLDRRARANGVGYKHCPAFYKAIQKYGFQNFTCEILKTVTADSLKSVGEQLNVWEQYYIELYNSLSPNGYNIRAGGDSKAIFSKDSLAHLSGSQHPNWRNDLNEEEIIKLYQSGQSLKAIAEQLKEPKETVKRHLQDKEILKEKNIINLLLKWIDRVILWVDGIPPAKLKDKREQVKILLAVVAESVDVLIKDILIDLKVINYERK